MKSFLLSILILPVVVFGAQVDETPIRKALDGRSVSCAEKADLDQAGFAVRDLEVRASGNELQFDLLLSYARCAKAGRDLVWVESEITNPISHADMAGRSVEVWQTDLEFVMTNLNSKQVGTSAGPLHLSFRVPLKRLLDEKSRQDLEQGLEVKTVVHIFPRFMIDMEWDGQSIFHGRREGAVYNVQLALARDSSGLQVRAVELH